jgi:hypothetical protein
MAYALKISNQKGGTMKLIKKKLNDLLTGLFNQSGRYGSSPGNYQMALIPIKK